jgi:glycosyltransferase involved in cell wall biosynthesis
MGLHVALDARLYHYSRAGIGQYTRQLLRALAAAAPDVRFTALQMRGMPEPLVAAPNVAVRRLATPSHHRWEQLGLAVELAALRSDVLHSPDFVPPFRRRCPAVITVHDLAFLLFPEMLTPASRRYYGQIHRAVRSAEAIVVVSESTRRDLLRLTDAPPERVRVVLEAADPDFRPLSPAGLAAGLGALKRPLPPAGFFLFVGTIEPRKNLPLLLDAYAAARARGLRRGLVVAGSRGWLFEETLRKAAALGLEDSLTLFGPASPAELRVLYNAAWALTLPSRYEGFGLPALEAMACGTPVLAAEVASLPEVVGAGGRLLPLTAEAWTEALLGLDQNAAERAALATRARAQAARFSWERAAAETLAIYQEVAA